MRMLDEKILRNLAAAIALSDHLGDVHEALDAALISAGLPEMPVADDGTMDYTGWLLER